MFVRGLILALCMACGPALAADAGAPAPDAAPKVLRYAFRVAETGFDPAQVGDYYSAIVIASIFDGLYEYEFLARPLRRRPNTAAGMPEHSDDYRTWTVRLKPGIHFADDPAFGGRRRELTAEDYVYSFKRHYDPRWKSPSLYLLENATLLGLSELRNEAIRTKQPFPYGRPVEGVRALDRYTLQFRLAEPRPRFPEVLTNPAAFGAVAREVVERYGERISEHPVGTGPYRLAEWRRASRMVLVRNPGFRERHYDEEAPADDPVAREASARLKGRRMPMVDRVEVSIVDENQPRWLAFLNGEHDVIEEVPPEYTGISVPNDELAPHLRKQGLTMVRYAEPGVSFSYFNMEDPMVGGYEPHKIALRRAMSLAVDVDKEIRLVRKRQAVPAQGAIAPGTWGHDPTFKSEMSEHDPARAKALLDLYGYTDRDGDGWREQPDGSPLRVEYATQPDQQSRQLVEQWQKNMAAIGVRIEFKTAKWPENLKASRAGKLMMWGATWFSSQPDGDTFLALAYGGAKGNPNRSRFELPAFDELYERQKVMPDVPERAAVMREAQRLMIAYMPLKAHVHRVHTDLAQPWMIGYHRNPFLHAWWHYVDLDPGRQPALKH
jgi:ABC-type transport system substrate-binding protein